MSGQYHHNPTRSLNGGNGHYLTHYRSSPSLNANGSSHNLSQLQQSQHAHQPPPPPQQQPFVTPRNSFDSLSNAPMHRNSTTGSMASNPWNNNYQNPFTNPSVDFSGGMSTNSGSSGSNTLSRHNSVFSGDSAIDPSYRSQPGSSGNETGVTDDQFGPKSDQEMKRLSTLLSNAGVSPQRPSVRHSQPNLAEFAPSQPQLATNGGGGAQSSLYNVDPAIDQAFRNMAKSLEEKDKQIERLKWEVEAMITAVTIGGSKNDVKVMENALSRKMDGNEVAHRLVQKLTTLTEENKRLGQMLSQGRAKQKEIELGQLRRQNVLLKGRIADEEAKQQQSPKTQPRQSPRLLTLPKKKIS